MTPFNPSAGAEGSVEFRQRLRARGQLPELDLTPPVPPEPVAEPALETATVAPAESPAADGKSKGKTKGKSEPDPAPAAPEAPVTPPPDADAPAQ